MRIAVLPCYNQNPYQARLIEAIRRPGYEVHTFSGVTRWLPGILEAKPDIVHFHWTHDLMLAPGWGKSQLKALAFRRQIRRMRRLGMTLVWTCHNLANHRGLFPAFERRQIQRIASEFDRIIVHHERAIDQVVEYFDIPQLRNRFVVIPHAHYRSDYPEQTSKPVARKKLNIPASSTVFLLFGQLRANKGIERLIESFRKLDPGNPELKLLLAGSANQSFRQVLEVAVQNSPRIDLRPGFVDDDLVESYHAAADVAVLPYSSGLTSGALILAMGFGLPVVCTDCGDARGEIAGRGGVVLNDTSPDTIRLALEQMLEGKNDWLAMGDRNAKTVARQNWKTMSDQTLACYREALGR